jgi:hypothetical protein
MAFFKRLVMPQILEQSLWNNHYYYYTNNSAVVLVSQNEF